MNKFIFILLSSVCMFATSCGIDIDYIYKTTLTFKNESSHKIKINVDSNNIHWKEPWDCIIKPNESYSHVVSDDPHGIIWWILGDGCIVIFDDEIVVDHRNTNIEHNLCYESSYTVKVSGRHDTKTTFTYVFTDEDYDRAVASMQAAESNTIQQP